MNDEQLENAKNAFFIALGIDMAVTAVSAASDFWAIDVFKGIAASGSAASQSVVGYIEFWWKFSNVMILTLIGVGWTLTRWLGACYGFAKGTIKATGFVQERWKLWGWVVPFLNLFKPYQVLSEIYKAGGADYDEDDGWKQSSGSGMLLTWWIVWVISHLLVIGIGKHIRTTSSLEGLTLNQVGGLYNAHIVVCVISLIVAGLWFVVADSLTRRLLNRQSKPARTAVSTNAANAGNDAYAAALAEIEEGRLDKGVWARALAESGGVELRAKALYIQARVASMRESEVLETTRPPMAEDAGAKPRTERSNQNLVDGILKMHPIVLIGAVFVLLLLAGSAISPGFRQGLWGLEPAAHVASERSEKAAEELPKLDMSQFTPENQRHMATEANSRGDYANAAQIYRALASQGDAFSQAKLGYMYANGQGVVQDNVRAHMWSNLSAVSGYALAATNRETFAMQMKPWEIAQAQQMARDCQQRNFKGCD